MKANNDKSSSRYASASGIGASSSNSAKGKGSTAKRTHFKTTSHPIIDKYLLANPSEILKKSNAEVSELVNRVTKKALPCLKQVNIALSPSRQEYMLSLAHTMIKTCSICHEKIAGNAAYHGNCRADFHPNCLGTYIKTGLEQRTVRICPGQSCQKNLTWSERHFYTFYKSDWKAEPIKIDHKNAVERQDFMLNLHRLPLDVRAGVIQGNPNLKALFHNDLTRAGLLAARPGERDGDEGNGEEVVEVTE